MGCPGKRKFLAYYLAILITRNNLHDMTQIRLKAGKGYVYANGGPSYKIDSFSLRKADKRHGRIQSGLGRVKSPMQNKNCSVLICGLARLPRNLE